MNTKLVWHDEPHFSFDYSTGQWFIGMAATPNKWHLKYIYYLYCYDRCISAFTSLARAKRVAELITRG